MTPPRNSRGRKPSEPLQVPGLLPTPTQPDFIGQPLTPVPGISHLPAMSRGEPGLPHRFTWRTNEYCILEILQSWKTSGPCSSGSNEQYLRRHWYKIRTDPPRIFTIYFERQPRRGSTPQARWWIYTSQHLPKSK